MSYGSASAKEASGHHQEYTKKPFLLVQKKDVGSFFTCISSFGVDTKNENTIQVNVVGLEKCQPMLDKCFSYQMSI